MVYSTGDGTDSMAAQAQQLARAFERFRFPEDRPSLGLRSPFSAAAAPKIGAFDWRERVRLLPAKHQGLCNACTAFTLASAIELLRQIAGDNQTVEVSAGHLHTCVGHGGSPAGTQICVQGIDLFRLVRALKDSGYSLASPGDYPFSIVSCAATPVVGHISSFTRINGVNEAKQRLLLGPLVADMYFWQDFFDYTTDRAPAYLPDMSSQTRYLHSVTVIGFNETGWIIRNSFGPKWGDGDGCAVIPYASCGLMGAPPPAGGVQRQAFALSI